MLVYLPNRTFGVIKVSNANDSNLYSLSDVLSILEQAGNKKLYDSRTVKSSFLDNFLFSGRFNSVLGLDGFQVFKDELREVIKRVNNEEFRSNYINLDEMYEVLLLSGVYYVDEHLPAELNVLKADTRWLTAYRYIAKNFPEINYKAFREVVKRFQNSDGHSFYLDASDTPELLYIGKQLDLFITLKDGKATLLQLSMKELKQICEKNSISPSRSIEETASRLVEKLGERVFDYVDPTLAGRKTLFIRDIELATGNDVIRLDQYLRIVAKVVREDLIEFINKQRYGMLAATGG